MFFIYFRDRQINVVLGRKFSKVEWLYFLYRKSTATPLKPKLVARQSFKQQFQTSFKQQLQRRSKKRLIAEFGFCKYRDFQTFSCYFINTKLLVICFLCVCNGLSFDSFELKSEHPAHTWLGTPARISSQIILLY